MFLEECVYELRPNDIQQGGKVFAGESSITVNPDGTVTFRFAEARTISEVAVKTSDGFDIILEGRGDNGQSVGKQVPKHVSR